VGLLGRDRQFCFAINLKMRLVVIIPVTNSYPAKWLEASGRRDRSNQRSKVVSISDDRNCMKEISLEERCTKNEKIILQNARPNHLPHKLCPLHGLVRDDGEHANCRVSSVPWWARHDS
jgi:hypothetical protein